MVSISIGLSSLLSGRRAGCSITDEIAGNLSVGNTITHEPDAIIQYDLDTVPASGGIFVVVREQDSSHNWQILIDSSGNLILRENNAGATQRASAAAVLSGGEKITITFRDAIITGYYDGTLAWEYTNATNFQEATQARVVTINSGTISGLVSRPYSAACLAAVGVPS